MLASSVEDSGMEEPIWQSTFTLCTMGIQISRYLMARMHGWFAPSVAVSNELEATANLFEEFAM